MTDVFISYSRKDSEFMHYLHDELSKQERDVWVDWEDIPATADWWDEIKTAIEAADAFAFIISPNSVRSEICHDEIQHAIDNNKRFIPLLYREISDLDAPYVHSAIRSHNWIPFSDESQYEAGVKKLLDSLSTEPQYVRRHTRLLVRAKDWELNERENSYLLVGDELNEFLKWIDASQTRNPKPTEIQLEYIYASQSRRNQRNLRIAAGATAGVFLFILLVAAYLIQQQRFERQQAAQNAQLTQERQLDELTSVARNGFLTQVRQQQEGTIAARNAMLTQQAQQEEVTSAAQNAVLTQAQLVFEANQTQVRENNFTILTQGALEAENADLKSTITAFASSATSEATMTQVAPTATAESVDNATPTRENDGESAATQIPPTPTNEAGAQQVMPTMPPPTEEGDIPPSKEYDENMLFVGREGNDNNDCRSPREGACKTISAALNKANPDETIEIAPGVYNETLTINKNISLIGFDADSIIISGNFEGTVITIEADTQVELYDLTVTGGDSETYGGGIVNYGFLYMENVIIEANSANLVGGGIANFGELDAVDVEVVQNYSAVHHDIYSDPRAWAELDNVDYEEDDRSPLELPQSEDDSFLQVNLLVQINTTDNERLNLRDKPGLNGRIVTKIPNESLAIITQGSEERNGFIWWELRLETGEVGWAADFVDDVNTIVPFDD